MSTTTPNQGLILPTDADLGDATTAMNNYNNGVENRVVQRFESAVDRGVRNPTPNKGELSYLADTDVHERYDGTTWRNLRGGVDHFFLPGETGTVSVTFTSQSAYFTIVSFATAFSLAPVVMTNISTGAGVSSAWTTRAYNISTTGFNLFLQNVNFTTSTWGGVPVDWVAIGRQ